MKIPNKKLLDSTVTQIRNQLIFKVILDLPLWLRKEFPPIDPTIPWANIRNIDSLPPNWYYPPFPTGVYYA